MTILEFWGCALITFGPAIAMFSLTVANDPIKIILLILSAFFWLLSFLVVAICWAAISCFCDYLIIGAYLAVLTQEIFRYLFHIVTKKVQIYLARIMDNENSSDGGNKHPVASTSIQADEVQSNSNNGRSGSSISKVSVFQGRIPMSYVSGLGFGLMNGAFSLMNVLTDYIGPGTVGLKGDSSYFLLVSSMTALAFILLNVAWSVLMSESIEKSDKKFAIVVVLSHLTATTITFVNRMGLQLISILVVYSLTVFCGLGAFQVAGLNVGRLVAMPSSTISI